MSASRCPPFWAEEPSILATSASDFFPFSEQAKTCTATALNSLTRFGIYFGILLAVLYRNGIYLGVSLGLAILSVAIYYGMKSKGSLREGFQNTIVAPTLIHAPGTSTPNLIGGKDVADKPVADVIGTADRTVPTDANPFMNLLVNEIKSNPTKPPAINVDTPETAREFSNVFQTRMLGDPTDVFQHNQNQRTWVTQPSTSIPNDRNSFQNWLYRIPGRTCKEGNNSVCSPGTDGGTVTWISGV